MSAPITLSKIYEMLFGASRVEEMVKECYVGDAEITISTMGEPIMIDIVCIEARKTDNDVDIFYEILTVRSSVEGFDELASILQNGLYPKLQLYMRHLGVVLKVEVVKKDATDELVEMFKNCKHVVDAVIDGGRSLSFSTARVRLIYRPNKLTASSMRMRRLFYDGINVVKAILIPDLTRRPLGTTYFARYAVILHPINAEAVPTSGDIGVRGSVSELMNTILREAGVGAETGEAVAVAPEATASTDVGTVQNEMKREAEQETEEKREEAVSGREEERSDTSESDLESELSEIFT